MNKLVTYLTFNGNCREAMIFYKDCLGGELNFQTLGDSPMADKLPETMLESILHSSLENEQIVLMGTDMVGEEGLTKGNSVSLLLECSTDNEIHSYYKALARGGQSTHPLERTYWGALFGAIIDKYGHHWLLRKAGSHD